MTLPPAELDALEKLAKATAAATHADWYVAGDPWLPSDTETYILAGSPDPHAGVMVCDMPTTDMAGVDAEIDDADWRIHNDGVAEYIAKFCPSMILRLIEMARK